MASTAARPIDGLMSVHLVVRPPSARMTHQRPEAERLREIRVVEVEPEPSAPISHAEAEEEQQRRQPEPGAEAGGQDRRDHTTAPTSRMTSRSIMRTSFRIHRAGRTYVHGRNLVAPVCGGGEARAAHQPRGAAARIQLIDCESLPTPDTGAILRRVAAEALILQDQAEAVLAGIANGTSWASPRLAAVR